MESPYKGTRKPEVKDQESRNKYQGSSMKDQVWRVRITESERLRCHSICGRFNKLMLTIGKEAKSEIGIKDSFLKFSWKKLLQLEARQAYSLSLSFCL